MRITALIASVAIVLASCDGGSTNVVTTPLPSSLELSAIASGLTDPLFLTSPPGDARLFIVEQGGTIRIVKNGQLLATPFLNIAAKLVSGEERGLLGLAFHPKFGTNGFFYVNYTDLNGNTKIERYHATPSSDVADAGSGTLVLGFTQPFDDHKGGMLVFGPDNMLWIGSGDGGNGGLGGDPQKNSENLATLLGKILRIDVDGASPYGVPPNNPFAGQTGKRGEIWGFGLRNPWRFSFDRAEGLLYIGDVGQSDWEEVDVVPMSRSAVNYGWDIMEGKSCFLGSACNTSGLEIPVFVYDHGQGCSIIGGYVYRGSAFSDIQGHYFYSDYCAGFLRSFRYANGTVTDEREWDVGDIGKVMSMGEDSQGELYVLSASGTVYKLTAR